MKLMIDVKRTMIAFAIFALQGLMHASFRFEVNTLWNRYSLIIIVVWTLISSVIMGYLMNLINRKKMKNNFSSVMVLGMIIYSVVLFIMMTLLGEPISDYSYDIVTGEMKKL